MKRGGLQALFACGMLSAATSCAKPIAGTEVDRLKRDPGLAELILIQTADPSTALDAAWERGDRRFLAVDGFAESVPGLDDFAEGDQALVHQQGFRVIAGTTDQGPAAELSSKATEYAAKYNQLLRSRLLASLGSPGSVRPADRH